MKIKKRCSRPTPETGINRRTFFAASASVAGALATGLPRPALAQSKQNTFVLVHGAWHGGWCWRDVRSRLEGEGHRVYTPTMTGLAVHSHMLTADVDMNTHIVDVVNLFRWYDLEKVTLVAHSYAGWVCSGALEAVERNVSSLVMVDAFLPEDGTSAYDTNSPDQKVELDKLRASGVITRPSPPARAFGVKTDKNRAWVDSKTTPQPVAAAYTKATLSGARERVKKKLFVRAEGFAQPAFAANYEATKADPTWNTYGVSAEDAGHDIMVDAPDLLSKLILDAAN